MNTYRVWISGQMAATIVTKQFPSSFEARRWMAKRYGLDIWDAVSRRVWDNEGDDGFNLNLTETNNG